MPATVRDVRYAEELTDQAVTDAALHEKWLLPSTPGAIVAEGMERTYRFQQSDIAKAVDVNAARKAFDLDLPHLGPYTVDFTPNGRDLLIGKTHPAVAGRLKECKPNTLHAISLYSIFCTLNTEP
jgi:U3 small nucleolar RNA-associated protein 7